MINNINTANTSPAFGAIECTTKCTDSQSCFNRNFKKFRTEYNPIKSVHLHSNTNKTRHIIHIEETKGPTFEAELNFVRKLKQDCKDCFRRRNCAKIAADYRDPNGPIKLIVKKLFKK